MPHALLSGELFVKFDDANLLSARLLRNPPPPQSIKPYDVPLLLHVISTLETLFMGHNVNAC